MQHKLPENYWLQVFGRCCYLHLHVCRRIYSALKMGTAFSTEALGAFYLGTCGCISKDRKVIYRRRNSQVYKNYFLISYSLSIIWLVLEDFVQYIITNSYMRSSGHTKGISRDHNIDTMKLASWLFSYWAHNVKRLVRFLPTIHRSITCDIKARGYKEIRRMQIEQQPWSEGPWIAPGPSFIQT